MVELMQKFLDQVPADFIARVNTAISLVCLLVVLTVLLIQAFGHSRLLLRSGPDVRLTGTGWALVAWAGWYLSLILTWVLITLGLDKKLTFLTTLAVSDLGNLCLVICAVALCRGRDFGPSRMWPMAIGTFALILWPWAVASLASESLSFEARILCVAPSAVLSAGGMLAVGWAVVVRCGPAAFPFFALALTYACAQIPGYMDEFVLVDHRLEHDHLISGFLALGKVFLASSFLGYALSPTHEGSGNGESPVYWPTSEENSQLHPRALGFNKWVGGILLSYAIGFATAAASPRATLPPTASTPPPVAGTADVAASPGQ